ncbi:MAG TPA: TrkA C-terminal domain-containing protein, partial [Actinomycetota bacterium]|nr:TrkA C-terminal domain-containing protein [Actinomycetota bacterium]
FVAVSSGDNSNILSARVAREHYKVPRVIARIYDPRRAEIYERLNIPTVASVRWAVKQIRFLLFHGKEEMRDTLAGGSLLLIQISVPQHLIGHKVTDLHAEGEIVVVGIDRGGSGFIPKEKSTFQEGDIAHAMVHKDALNKLDLLLEPTGE